MLIKDKLGISQRVMRNCIVQHLFFLSFIPLSFLSLPISLQLLHFTLFQLLKLFLSQPMGFTFFQFSSSSHRSGLRGLSEQVWGTQLPADVKPQQTSNFILHLTGVQKITLQYITDQCHLVQKSLGNQEASFISNRFFLLPLSVTPESNLIRERCLFHLCYSGVVLRLFSVSALRWRFLVLLRDTTQPSKEPTRTPANAVTMTAQ